MPSRITCGSAKSSKGIGSVADAKRPKKIRVYNNGESHCYFFILNPREFKGWTAILDYMTKIINPDYGHIAKLLSLCSLTEIQCFDDLVSETSYVALGQNSKFKNAPGGYGVNSYQNILRRDAYIKQYYCGKLDPCILPLLCETEKKNLVLAYFLVNGKKCQCPQKVVFNRCDLKRETITMNYLAKIMDVPDGIHKVATIFGDILNNLREIQHGFPYVAIPHNKQFVHMNYLNFFCSANKCNQGLKFNIRKHCSSKASGTIVLHCGCQTSLCDSKKPKSSVECKCQSPCRPCRSCNSTGSMKSNQCDPCDPSITCKVCGPIIPCKSCDPDAPCDICKPPKPSKLILPCDCNDKCV
ncbi:unnamed protein product [Phyllotreta striolata]|uniref:Doublecortin domain-containing protein n=1 Tax=Phyllotreta striolata TaxID=444603 RepID=A0A9N9XPR9_PHYSR|nr:unnamed protein product [Phyllotreta striolata]